MDKLKARAQQILTEVKKAETKLNFEDLLEKIAALELEVSQPEIWNNPQNAQRKMRVLNDLKKTAEPWQTLRAQAEDLLELMEISDELEEEFAEQIAAFEIELEKLKKELLFDGEYDSGAAIVRITSGVGGTDAQDFAEMLERMYLRWAEKNDFQTTQIERSVGEEAGIKTSVFEVEGQNAYGKMRSENGVHRLVRISPFNSGGSRETSFALVEILPKIDAPEQVQINEKDLRIDIYRSSGKGGQGVNTTDSAVRITHLPTGVVVAIQNERSQTQNKETAMNILRGKLAQMQIEQHAKNLSELQAGKSAEWGAQIRNYVLNPYKLVKDTRTKHEEKDVEKVLNGEIDGFIYAFLENSSGEA
ncbi:MAG: peptide chain release factor 2 [bacterium]|nr:peptide chain release factor 2 [bacterium]